jgi:catechol 2,3-dioxygenase-like lactoylglutathione lyase family enzyme
MKALNHVTVVVKDLDQATKLYSDLLGIAPPAPPHPYGRPLAIQEPGFKTKIRLLEMPNNCFLELVEPVEGPQGKLLQEKGEGAVWMLGFRVDDIEKAYDELRAMGITPADRHGPITDKKYRFGLCGEKLFTIPPEKTGGIRIELVERHF